MDTSEQTEPKSPPPPAASKFLQQHTHHDDKDEKVERASRIPYRGFNKSESKEVAHVRQPPRNEGAFSIFLRGLFSPRETDIQQLLVKLQAQFETLDIEHHKTTRIRDGGRWDDPTPPSERHHSKEDFNDKNHPINNPNLMREVHFVGRKAANNSIIDISNLLMTKDHFGSITELWMNNNLISDEGAEAIASFLELPTCSLVELWLGDNQIGAAGTTLISAALSNNPISKLKCLGLYKNPLGNGGALALAQMLRKNNTLSTLDVHGCGNRGSSGHEVLEGYGCKVIKAIDGTEYVARVVAQDEEEEGLVTDQRLLDAIQTFVAFNRIDPTREQAVRGIMSSNKISQDDTPKEGGEKQTMVAKFLSDLSSKPATEKLLDDEKRKWKDCEWERLYVELERARQAKAELASRLEVTNNEIDDFENDGTFPVDHVSNEETDAMVSYIQYEEIHHLMEY